MLFFILIFLFSWSFFFFSVGGFPQKSGGSCIFRSEILQVGIEAVCVVERRSKIVCSWVAESAC